MSDNLPEVARNRDVSTGLTGEALRHAPGLTPEALRDASDLVVDATGTVSIRYDAHRRNTKDPMYRDVPVGEVNQKVVPLIIALLDTVATTLTSRPETLSNAVLAFRVRDGLVNTAYPVCYYDSMSPDGSSSQLSASASIALQGESPWDWFAGISRPETEE